MTIRFKDVDQLRKLFGLVNTSYGQDALSATSCVLLEQIAEDKTQLTTIEPGRAVFQRTLQHTDPQSGGDLNESYLIDQIEFNTKLNRVCEAKAGSLTFRERRGVLSFLVDHSLLPDGSIKQRGTVTVRQYPGARSDFDPGLIPSTLVATVPAHTFNSWVRLLADFGKFSGEQAFEGTAMRRTVLVELINEELRGLTNNKEAVTAFLLVTQLAQVEQPCRFAIEGRQLKRLLFLASDGTEADPNFISIYKDTDSTGVEWVRFSGEKGSTTLVAVESEQRFVMNYRLFDKGETRLVEVSERGCVLSDFSTALTLQIPAKTEPLKDVLILEDGRNFTILQSHRIDSANRSTVELDPTLSKGEWTPPIAYSQALAAVTKTIAGYHALLRAVNQSLLLTQKYITKPSGTKAWLLFIQPSFSIPALTIQSFIMVKEASEHVDLLDVEE